MKMKTAQTAPGTAPETTIQALLKIETLKADSRRLRAVLTGLVEAEEAFSLETSVPLSDPITDALAKARAVMTKGDNRNNPMCDGSGPCDPGLVRLLPLSRDPCHGNIILCRRCFEREIEWRQQRNTELAEDRAFDLPAWTSLPFYGKDPVLAQALKEGQEREARRDAEHMAEIERGMAAKRLHDAAPDMLEALLSLDDAYGVQAISDRTRLTLQAWAKARAAISKAKGKA